MNEAERLAKLIWDGFGAVSLDTANVLPWPPTMDGLRQRYIAVAESLLAAGVTVPKET